MLQDAIDNCQTNDAGIDACPAFAPWHSNVYKNPGCTPIGDYPDEEVGTKGPIKALPGCNPLWGDEPTKPTCTQDGATPQLNRLLSPNVAGWNPLGCASEANGMALTAVSLKDQMNLTVSSCLATCKAGGYSYAGVEYVDLFLAVRPA